jgi:hypothetical protein
MKGKRQIKTYLSSRVGNLNGVEDLVEVVGDETVAGPLREEGNTNNGNHTSPVAGSGEQSLVANFVLD